MNSPDVTTDNDSPASAIERATVFIVTTGHIQQYDSELLESLAIANGDFPPINCGLCGSTKHGFLLWIGSEGLEDDYAAELSSAGFSSSFASLLERIYRESSGFCYLLLDSDGDEITGLPLHEW